MNRKKSYELNEEMINKIISVAYNDANILERYRVYRAAKYDNKISELLQSYRSTANEVHGLKEETCPEAIIVSIEKKSIALQSKQSFFSTDLITVILGRPLVSAFTSVIVVAAILVALFTTRPVQTNYSRQEIENADRQTRQALAIVGKIFNQTETTLKKEVLTDRVSKPIRDGLGIVNSIFN